MRARKRWCIVNEMAPISGDAIYGQNGTETKALFWCMATPHDDWHWNVLNSMRFWTKRDAERYLIVVAAKDFKSNVGTIRTLKIPDRYL